MSFTAFSYRVGTLLALIAIYDAVGGPQVGDGGYPMLIAMVLMAVPVFYVALTSVVNDIRRRREEAPA